MSRSRWFTAFCLFFCSQVILWPTESLAQPLLTCPTGFETVEVSGQTEIPIVEAFSPTTQLATAMFCFNPQENCFLAISRGQVNETLPFSAADGNGNLTIMSLNSCGGQTSTRGKPFEFVASSSGAGACLDTLSIDNNGVNTSGRLLGDGSVEIMLDNGAELMMDIPYMPDAMSPQSVLLGPAFHDNLQLAAAVPTLMNGAIQAMSPSSGEAFVNGICGIAIGGDRPTQVPSLSRWALALLCGLMLVATVWITRRRGTA